MNELKPGDTRIGWLIDGDPLTPERAVALRNTGTSIELEIPTHGMSRVDDQYSRWFQSGVHHGDDPDKSLYDYSPPSCLSFYDVHGSVSLVGCRAGPSSMGGSAGYGVVQASGAVLGANEHRYDHVHGVRSIIPALAGWSGLTSARQERQVSGDGRVQSLRLELQSGDPLRLAREKNLLLRPSWRAFPGEAPGQFVSVDELHLETSRSSPAPIEEHLRLHDLVRQLLLIAAGGDLGFAGFAINRRDDPHRSIDGTDHGPKWSPYLTYELPSDTPSTRPTRFMFGLDDIGTTGVARWLKLHDTFSRGLQPLVALVASKQEYLESRLFMAGIAFEAIGYELENAAGGKQFNRAGNLAFPVALEVVLGDIGWQALRDQDDWKRDMIAAYKGVKHADQPLPDTIELYDVVRAAALVLRIWVASRLGCRQVAVLRRLLVDSRARNLVPEPAR
jgi:hypothetical protein